MIKILTFAPIAGGVILKKKVEKDYHDLAQARGFKWVGEALPKTTKHKTTWQCLDSHRWNAHFNSISAAKSGCPHCSGKFPKIEKDYHDAAKSRGFKWVDKRLPKNVLQKTKWQCSKGHKWEACFDKVSNQGTGCPECHIFKGPACIVETLNVMGLDFETEKRFPTCRHKLELPFDFYIPSAKLLIEYQGEHHFRNVWGLLSNVKRNDKIKKDWAQKNGYELLAINYWEFDRIAEILTDRLQDYATFECYKQGRLL